MKLENEETTRWICRECWRIMPRTEAEKHSLDHSSTSKPLNWKCSSCGAVGRFASHSSPEWAEFANDLVFHAYAKCLQEAGYEVLEYSVECDRGDHGDCAAKNRLTGNIPPPLSRCWCRCHTNR